MKKLVAITTLVSGILLILVPRYILPACEYEGFPRMHCSDTALSEYVVGALLIVIGGLMFFIKSARMVIAGALTAIVLYGVSFWLPDKFGYCQSPRMPCHYGMVPGIRFIDAAGALIMIGAIIGLLRTTRRKGNS
jgi:hypothetical protein